jgi:ABC-type transporter Mla maintaining outer membrane lipid asymmetry ATPase subunit MlaF
MKGASTVATQPVIAMDGVATASILDADLTVAESVNWSVAAGDYWVIAGLQGTGKSDFLLMAGGLMGPKQGRYMLFGEHMPIFDDARLGVRLRLGLVFEGGQLLAQLTVRENVALPLRYHHNLSAAQAHDAVTEALEEMELGPWADTTPGRLSRNWRKRVGLARALMLKPELLLIDDPIAGMDLPQVQWWLGFLDELAKGRKWPGNGPLTLVVTTSDLRPWKDRARQYAVLQDKSFRILGSWSEVEADNSELIQKLLMSELAQPENNQRKAEP